MVTRMDFHRQLGHAGLVGGRKTLADRVAPQVAKHGPVDEEDVRAIIGVVFFAVAVYYVAATLARAVKASR
jgi:hypothetical protein